MVLSSIVIIALVKYVMVPGIDHLSAALGWSLKARGKATGYATSVPEFVALVAAGLSQVWEAGLWNIASSNLLNLLMAAAAVIGCGRAGAAFDRRYLKEAVFSAVGITAPIVLMQFGADTSWGVVPVLLSLFAVYILFDKGDGALPEGQAETGGSAAKGGVMIAVSLALIMVAGDILGTATRDVVQVMGLPAIVAGCILGLVTSLPEGVSFFEAFSTSRSAGPPDPKAQVQELFDTLAASNMSNSGLIYPLGLTVYLLGSSL